MTTQTEKTDQILALFQFKQMVGLAQIMGAIGPNNPANHQLIDTLVRQGTLQQVADFKPTHYRLGPSAPRPNGRPGGPKPGRPPGKQATPPAVPAQPTAPKVVTAAAFNQAQTERILAFIRQQPGPVRLQTLHQRFGFGIQAALGTLCQSGEIEHRGKLYGTPLQFTLDAPVSTSKVTAIEVIDFITDQPGPVHGHALEMQFGRNAWLKIRSQLMEEGEIVCNSGHYTMAYDLDSARIIRVLVFVRSRGNTPEAEILMTYPWADRVLPAMVQQGVLSQGAIAHLVFYYVPEPDPRATDPTASAVD